MKKTYDEILSAMKNIFYEKCGESVEKYSELETRLKAVASELFSLYCNSDFVLRQAFPQTAEGEYLDFHAQLRGITRKTPSKAKLSLTFYLNEPSEETIIIEEGCICASEKNPYIQFVTKEDGIIFAGDVNVTVEAEATECGSSHNVNADEVTVIVNPPLGVSGVTNEAPLTLGFDEENDSMLRKRILSAYSVPSTGFSLISLKESVLGLDEIIDCGVSFYDNVLTVAVKTANPYISSSLRRKIEDRLLAGALFGAQLEIISAQRHSVNLTVNVKCSSSDYERIKAQLEEKIKDLSGALRIGEALSLSKTAYSISCVEGVDYCEISCSEAAGSLVLCESDEYLYIDTLEVFCYE